MRLLKLDWELERSTGKRGIDVNVDGKGDLATEDTLEFASGKLSDLLHPFRAAPNEHPLVTLVGYEHGGIDAKPFGMGGRSGHDLDPIYVHAAAVGDFVLGLEINLFPDDLGDLEVPGGVRGVGGRIKRRSLGEEIDDEINEVRETGAGGAGNVQGMLVGRGEGKPVRAMRAFAEIGFAQAEDSGFGDFSERLRDKRVFRAGSTAGVDQMEHDIDIGEGFAGPVVELLDESGAAGVEKAGGVHEHDLAAGMMDDAVEGIASRLGFWGDDGDFPADEGIEEGGFAGVGTSDQGGETGTETGRGIVGSGRRRRDGNVHGLMDWTRERCRQAS
jgi:hypothetical protein